MWEWRKQVSSALLGFLRVGLEFSILEGGIQLLGSGHRAKSLGGYLNENRGNIIEGQNLRKGWDENSGSPRASRKTYGVRLPV